jgi:hypothetical protein
MSQVHKYLNQNKVIAQAYWLTPVIPATLEVEIGKVMNKKLERHP